MTNEALKTGSVIPVKTVADALDAAVEIASKGAGQVAATASGVVPALGRVLSGFTFNTCYAISYGVVFPTVLVARLIPKKNAVVYGLIDGARAAADMVHELKSPSLTGAAVSTSQQGQAKNANPVSSAV